MPVTPLYTNGNPLFIKIDGSIDNNIQDQTTPLFQYYMMEHLNATIQLTSPANIDDTTINVTGGHGFIVGNSVVLWENSGFEQCKVTNVATNVISISVPLGNTFTTDAIVIRGNIEMNVLGAPGVGERIFSFIMYDAEVPIDITNIRLNLTHTQGGDDSKFGDVDVLPNGMYVRKQNENISNYGNYQRNLDFVDRNGDVFYDDKAGGGLFSTKVVFQINGRENFGVVIRIDPRFIDPLTTLPRVPDSLSVHIRDDLTDLDSFRMSLIGSYTEGE